MWICFRTSVIASVTPLLTGLKSLWQDWTKEEIKFRIREVLLVRTVFILEIITVVQYQPVSAQQAIIVVRKNIYVLSSSKYH